jgi:AbrB family looped-hinge helix DNA binding protein
VTDEYRPGKVQQRKVAEAVLAYDSGWEEPVLMTISSKNQITLPVQLLRELGLRPGDRLAVKRDGDRLILRPRPKNWVQHYRGKLEGYYGKTKEEIDAYVQEQRDDGGYRDRLIEEAWNGKRPAAKE